MNRKVYFISVVLLISTLSCPAQYKENNAKQKYIQRELLKDYFLCAFISEGFKDKQIDSVDLSQAVYFDILRYNPEAMKQVKDYAKKFVISIKPSPINDLGERKAIILSCIEKYRDRDLSNLIRRMDKYILTD